MINISGVINVTVVDGSACKSESIKARDLVVGDFILYHGNWHYVANNWYCAQSSYAKLNLIAATEFEVKGMKSIPLATKIPLNEHVTIRSREEQAMLAMQNAHKQTQVVAGKLEQLISISNMSTTVDGLVQVGSFEVLMLQKETLLSTARTELKAEGNKLAEMLKKI